MKNGIIYKAENLINGKVYIGQTTTRFNNRISGHKHHAYILNRNTLFCKALRKYGFDNFKWSIILICNGDYWLNYYETALVKLYKSNDRKYGYNLTDGGEGTRGFKHDDVFKFNMSKRMKGNIINKGCDPWNKGKENIYSEETRQKMSLNKKANYIKENHPNFGKPHSEETKLKISNSKQNLSQETRLKMSEAQKNRYKNELNPMQGRKHSEETRLKIKEKSWRRWGKI